jgi:GAF domain-containing protein
MISEVTRGFAEATTDWERLLSTVASGLTRVVGQSCVVMLLSPDGAELRGAAIHASDAKIQATLRAAFETRPMTLADRPRVRALIERGESYIEPSNEPASADRAHWQRALGLHSALAVPLRVTGRPLGALFMGRFSPELPPYDEADRDLARNLADHAALAIENSRFRWRRRLAARRIRPRAIGVSLGTIGRHGGGRERAPTATHAGGDAGGLLDPEP